MSTIKTILATTILATTLTANAEFQYIVDLPPSFKASNVEYTLSEDSPVISNAIVTNQGSINTSSFDMNVSINPITTTSATVEVTNKSNEIIHTQTIGSTTTEIINIASEGIEFVIDGSAGYNSSEDYTIGLVGSILDVSSTPTVELASRYDGIGTGQITISVVDHTEANNIKFPLRIQYDGFYPYVVIDSEGNNYSVDSSDNITFSGVNAEISGMLEMGDFFEITRTN
jgi:hypothetical protein